MDSKAKIKIHTFQAYDGNSFLVTLHDVFVNWKMIQILFEKGTTILCYSSKPPFLHNGDLLLLKYPWYVPCMQAYHPLHQLALDP